MTATLSRLRNATTASATETAVIADCAANMTRRRSGAVGEHAAPEREHDDRQHAREADEAEREGRLRQQVDVPVDGDHLHLRAGLRDELGQPEPAEVGMAEGVVGPAQDAALTTAGARGAPRGPHP